LTTTGDIYPEAFGFDDALNVPIFSRVESNVITISGLVAAAPISIDYNVGNLYRINGGAYRFNPGVIRNGDTLQVSTLSEVYYSTSKRVRVTIGDQTGIFLVKTQGSGSPFRTHSWPDEATKKKGGSSSSGLFGSWFYLNLFTFFLVMVRFNFLKRVFKK